MKRVGYLADKVFTRENVRAAWDAYNKNRPVRLRKAFDQSRADRILRAARRDFAAVVANPREKTIFEGGKERRLQIPRFAASIAMLMLWNVAGPYVERRIHSMSFSSRKGMGGHLAAAKCSRFLRTRRSFCVFSAHPTKRLYLSLMSRKGWLMSINKHFSTVFKLPNGGYLWQAR